MPVYDHTYQTWEGVRRGPLFRWLAIPKFAYMEFLGNRLFIWLFTLAWAQFILRLGYLYLFVNMEFLRAFGIPVTTLVPVDAFFFKNMIDVQLLFCFAFAFLLGSGLISRDLKHNAVVLYMTKPINRWEYFLGKFSVLFFLIMLITWFQTMLLLVIQVGISPEHSEWRLYFWDQYAWLFGAITFYSLVVATSLSLFILACSSLTKNARYAGITFAAYIIGASIVAGVLVGTLNNQAFMVISPMAAGVEIGYYIFHIDEGRRLLGERTAWSGILGLWVVCGVILKWRLDRAARYGR